MFCMEGIKRCKLRCLIQQEAKMIIWLFDCNKLALSTWYFEGASTWRTNYWEMQFEQSMSIKVWRRAVTGVE